ncbi:leukocyte elastase inhibitor-like [Pollicipes pollicipes]|uniref:leukocyte elastase inhibitor-like n=1 Tax=Pollicipes pollicipes TaxID=41117 RepID=UPI001885A2FA|nr:leukocyte elastase inhibitor-like [Pollicipes pollicipes]
MHHYCDFVFHGPCAWLAPLLLLATLGGACVPTGLDMKLLKEVTSGPVDNHVISPFLMSLLMSQVWLGAEGTTRAEVRPQMMDLQSFLDGYRSALAVLSENIDGVTTSVFSRIYRTRRYSVRRTFSDLLANFYGSGVELLPSDARKAAQVINNQVSAATRGRIRGLKTTADLTSAALVLISAVHFKGTWLYRFKKDGQKPFLTSDGDRRIDMMKVEARLGIAGQPNFDVVELPYQNQDYSLLVLRPRFRTLFAVTMIRKSLDSLNVTWLHSQLHQTKVRVVMPSFKLERSYELPFYMKKLGIRQIFHQAANFRGMSSDKIFVSKIIHKAVMEVNEEGTTAKATAVFSIARSLPITVPFIVDRPFYVILYHKRERVTLFAGLVANP